ncbi:MAG: 16S rRNA methyltransferase [Desulfurococcales archaeon]|nr:16S rRNA methyltransferase [Desulfurococcales archaeon]
MGEGIRERRGKVKIVFLESSIELVPEDILGEPDVVRSAQRYGVDPREMLLDKSLHYRAMSRLPFKWKRGRPDILHVALLTVLDSPLVEEGALDVYFHTVEDRIFRVIPETRIPKSYERFRGLMAQLLRIGHVPPGSNNPLIYELGIKIEDLLSDGSERILLWEDGKLVSVHALASLIATRPVWVGIGAFPKGDFSKRILSLFPKENRYSIGRGRQFTAWGTVSRVLCGVEQKYGLI